MLGHGRCGWVAKPNRRLLRRHPDMRQMPECTDPAAPHCGTHAKAHEHSPLLVGSPRAKPPMERRVYGPHPCGSSNTGREPTRLARSRKKTGPTHNLKVQLGPSAFSPREGRRYRAYSSLHHTVRHNIDESARATTFLGPIDAPSLDQSIPFACGTSSHPSSPHRAFRAASLMHIVGLHSTQMRVDVNRAG